MSSGLLDLHALDRDVARANGARIRFRAALVRDPEAGGDEDPLASFRNVAGQKAHEALTAFRATGLDVPLREALLLWVYALTQARIGRELEVEWAREAAGVKAHVLLDAPRDTSYREAWREAVFAKNAGTRRSWIDAAASRGPKLASIAREAAGNRVEVARRFGFAHPAAPASPSSHAALYDAAWTLLRTATDLLAALRRESRTRLPEAAAAGPLPLWIQDGLATDASEGWPAHLSPRWLEDSFREVSRGARLSFTLPRVAGAATFSRALRIFGRALRRDGRSALPFSIATDPFHVDEHRFGAVFGSLPMTRVFHRKVLGLSERLAHHQARALARTTLYESVWIAARFLLTYETGYAKADLWDEITHVVFGAPIDPLFMGAWPSPDGEETSVLEALLTAPALTTLLVGRFDDDWFLNPHAAEWIHARASGPAREPPDGEPMDPSVAAASLARSFEEALG
jgi:hypothetical protein